jgi:hypothetical protein
VQIATSAREAIERFKAAEAHARAVLAGIAPEPVAPTPLPDMVPPPQRRGPDFQWSGDVRTLGEETAAHAEVLRRTPPPIRPGSVGQGKLVDGIAGGKS